MSLERCDRKMAAPFNILPNNPAPPPGAKPRPPWLQVRFSGGRKFPGARTDHAHARTAHGVRERAMPEHGRVLGTSHGNVHDSWETSARVRADSARCRAANRSGPPEEDEPGARGRGGRADGIALRGGDVGESRRPAGRRRGDFRAHDRRDSPARSRLQSRSADPGFSRRLGRRWAR